LIARITSFWAGRSDAAGFYFERSNPLNKRMIEPRPEAV
jgi:hypothetical protein